MACPNGAHQLTGLGVLVGRRAPVGDRAPVFSLEWDLASLPGAAAELDRGFEQGELVRPGREPALAAEVVELGEDGQQRVVGALLGEVLAIAAPQVRQGAAAAAHLEASGLEQELPEVAQGLVALGALGA